MGARGIMKIIRERGFKKMDKIEDKNNVPNIVFMKQSVVRERLKFFTRMIISKERPRTSLRSDACKMCFCHR